MDELENNPLALLLVLDDNLFPQLLEWASIQGWSTLLLFVLETDFFRFRGDGIDSKLSNVGQTFLSSRVEEFQLSLTTKGGVFNAFLDEERTRALVRIAASQIPLHCVLSQVCDIVWAEILSKARHITKSSAWASVRRSMIADMCVDLDFVMRDTTRRIYFERFLQVEQANLASLHCYVEVQRLLLSVRAIKIKSQDHTNIEAQLHSSVAAIADARHTLQSGSGSMISSSCVDGDKFPKKNEANTNVSGEKSEIQPSVGSDLSYANPLEAFKELLIGTRLLQKQFFPVGNSSKVVGGIDSHVVCGGLSEALRMEISMTLSLNSSVRAADIDSIEPAFAEACTNSLRTLLVLLECEMQRHLLSLFKSFEQSSEYALMIASAKAQECGPICRYYSKLEFLYDTVRREKNVLWTDPRANGKMYLVYGLTDREGLANEAGFDSHKHQKTSYRIPEVQPDESVETQTVSDAQTFVNAERSEKSGVRGTPMNARRVEFMSLSTHSPSRNTGPAEGKSVKKSNSESHVNFHNNADSGQRVIAINAEFKISSSGSLTLRNISSMLEGVSLWAGDMHDKDVVVNAKAEDLRTSVSRAAAETNSPNPAKDVDGGISDTSTDYGSVAEITDDDVLTKKSNDSTTSQNDETIAERSGDGSKAFYLHYVDVDGINGIFQQMLNASNQRSQYTEVQLDGSDLIRDDPDKSSSDSLGNQRTLSTLLASLILTLTASHDFMMDMTEHFVSPTEEVISFIVDSKGLKNLHNLLFGDDMKGKVRISDAKEFLDSFSLGNIQYVTPRSAYKKPGFKSESLSLPTSATARLFSANADTFHVAMCVKATLVRQTTERIQLPVTSTSSFPKYSNRITISLACCKISASVLQHSRVSLLQNIAARAFLHRWLPAGKAVMPVSKLLERRMSAPKSSLLEDSPVSKPPLVRRGSVELKYLSTSRPGGAAATVSQNTSREISIMKRLASNTEIERTTNNLVVKDTYLLQDKGESSGHQSNFFCSVPAHETLYDIYVGDTAHNSPTLLGVCDFSLAGLVEVVSARLLVQICMLLVTDQSIVLVSSSPTLLTKLQLALPRLVWPFRLGETHNFVQLPNASALSCFLFGTPPRNGPEDALSGLESPAGKSPEEPPRSASKTFLSKIGSLFDSVSMPGSAHSASAPVPTTTMSPSPYSVTKSPEAAVASTPACNYDRVPKSNEQVRDHNSKSWVIGLDTKALYDSPHCKIELCTQAHFKGRSPVVFDLDICSVLERETFVHEQSSPAAGPLPISRLANPKLFKSANFDDFREVIDAISHQVIEFKSGFNSSVSRGSGDATAVSTFIQESNAKVEESFHLFWVAIFLHLLPNHILHYHEPRIIACDVRGLLLDLLENISSTADIVSAERAAQLSEPSRLNFYNLRQLPLSDLIAHLSSLYSSTANMFQIFYLELLSNSTSPVFRDLLLRHSAILDNWRF